MKKRYSRLVPVRLSDELDNVAREFPGGRSAAIRAGLAMLQIARAAGPTGSVETESATR